MGRIEAEDDGTNAGFLFNPAVIDGTFQASCAFNDLDNLPGLRIPLSIDKVAKDRLQDPFDKTYGGVFNIFQYQR